MRYVEMKQKHMNEINNFPMAFAFSKEQFQEGLEKLGTMQEDICSIPGGGFIRKTDTKALGNMMLRHVKEMDKGFEDDDFLVDAIEYELANHEFIITYDPEPALNVLGINLENADKRVMDCFETARKNYMEWQDSH